MPAVDISMARSLRHGSVLNVLTRALFPVVSRRSTLDDVQGKITDVKTAFSSWDNCMKADFCKWPVIAIIIVGALIIFSIVWCIARCACCGLSCCCECFYCFKCCGECCGCCSPPRGKAHKYLDEPFIPPNHQGYHSQEPMTARAAVPGTAPSAPSPYAASSVPAAASAFPAPKSAAAFHDTPQYATFDVAKKEHPAGEDSLPEMPSWESANQSKVLVEDNSVEMSNLKKPEAGSTSPALIDTGSPNGMYAQGQAAASNGFVAGAAAGAGAGVMAGSGVGGGPGGAAAMGGPYRQNSQGFSSVNNVGRQFSGSEYSSEFSQYGSPRPGYGMRSPGPQQQQQQQQQQPGVGTYPMANNMNNMRSGSYDDYRRGTASPQQNMQQGNFNYGNNNYNDGYNMDRRTPRLPDVGMPSNGQAGYNNSTPGELYGGAMPTPRSPPNAYGAGRQTPSRSYSGGPRGYNTNVPQEMPSSPTNLRNNGGFDFSSGYSRPATRDQDQDFHSGGHGVSTGVSAGVSNGGPMGYGAQTTRSPSPMAQPQPQSSQQAYPGHRPYQGPGTGGGW